MSWASWLCVWFLVSCAALGFLGFLGYRYEQMKQEARRRREGLDG